MTHLDWSSDLYRITQVQQSNNKVCYYKVKDEDEKQLKRNFYYQELNFVSRE